jgi:2-polyprenyl-3-methyl-5-hydroxy-6-metoxy-1,4-benzoquinol methylase
MDTPSETNRRRWNEITPIHAASDFYDVPGFRAGKSSLRPTEVEELGEVRVKSLLHLQCHFGLDTLSWARQGANVTGMDFSQEAIALAQSLATELNIKARFLCCNLYDLPRHLQGVFDIVFTSYGVLPWLSNLHQWAIIIDHFLKPGGVFYIIEFHPLVDVFDDSPQANALKLAYPYFPSAEPLTFDNPGTYANRSASVKQTRIYQWAHSLGEIVSALTAVRLHIEFLHEFSFCAYARFPFLRRDPDGWWRLPEHETQIPLMFSLKATKG